MSSEGSEDVVSEGPNPAAPSETNESLGLFSDETIENLTNGFLEILQPEVVRVQTSLEELM